MANLHWQRIGARYRQQSAKDWMFLRFLLRDDEFIQ